VFAVSFIQDQLGRTISFIEWMSFAVPLVIVFVPLVWLALTRWIYPLKRAAIPGAQELFQKERNALPPLSRAEYLTLIIFAVTALAWITRPLLNSIEIANMKPLEGLSDAGIAMLSATALFVTPVDFRKHEFLMDWSTAVRLPWGMLILFGGGLALAAAIVSTGLNVYLGSLSAALNGWPVWAIVLVITGLVVFLTELVSNTATTATLIPVILAVAIGMSLPPLLLIIPATFAASCAFMLPVATPPNAIVFGSGRLTIAQMSRAGFVLNFLAIALITLATYAILMPLLGIKL
jgi:sodium-dependent dicarboxylate transporter 2/3/5